MDDLQYDIYDSGRNELKNLDGISKFKNIRKLLMARDGMKDIFDEVFECQSLQDLWLDANILNGISDKIANLTNLKSLYINACQLSALP